MQEFDWENNVENKEQKIEVAKKILNKVKNNDVIGFGSGTTSYIAIKLISEKIKQEKLNIKAIPTSKIIEQLCNKLNIKTTTLKEQNPDWCFDGADEVDQNNNLIKGMGAALYREKLNIKASKENYILVDETKLVDRLGEKHPVPVEVEIDKIEQIQDKLIKLGAYETKIKKSNTNNEELLITDNGNAIIYAYFNNIEENLENKINQINGVIENGLFIGYNVIIIK